MIDWWTNLNNIFVATVTAIITAVISAVVLLIRKVITNEKQIAVLKQEINTRNEYRLQKDNEVTEALTEIRGDIKLLIGKMVSDINYDK